jgi:hypothetical protein
MHAQRSRFTATLLPDGRVLVAGDGPVGSAPASVWASAEVYDPATGMWTPTSSMHDGRYGHTETPIAGGRVLVAGGGQRADPPLASAELYDSTTATWTLTGSMSAHRFGHAAALLGNGEVLAAGGDGLASAELYDAARGVWISASSMSTVRSGHTATVLVDGDVLITGGADGNEALASAEIFRQAATGAP